MGYNVPMIRRLLPLAVVLLLGCSSSSETPAGNPDTGTTGPTVMVGQGGTVFVPATLTIKAGQTVTWKWAAAGHSVTQGDPAACAPKTGGFDSTIQGTGATFTQKFDTAGTIDYFCLPHCGSGMKGQIIVTP
jgi:plastocyanin